jgi:hypothetical protein
MTRPINLLFLALLVSVLPAQAASLFSTNTTWKYFKGRSEASSPVDAWRSRTFNDSGWASGDSPFHYGEGISIGTLLNDMQGQYTCIFMRKTFTISDPAEVVAMRLGAISDDGFIAWINGVEVHRFNMPAGAIAFNGVSGAAMSEPLPFNTFILSNPSPASYLVAGENVIAIQAFNASLSGSSDFLINAELSSVKEDFVPPTVLEIDPAPGTITTLNQITVTFSEPVVGVGVNDLRINGQEARSMTSSGNAYSFHFPQPPYGPVHIDWIADHGIVDFAIPPNSFDASAPGATWSYNLEDLIPPTAALIIPPPSLVVRALTQIEVNFSEPVTGVDASDLLINGVPATNVATGLPGQYLFRFAEPAPGPVQVTWSASHGIQDLAVTPNSFPGEGWDYLLDPNAPPPDLRLNEFVASNQNGLQDEDGSEEDWIEIYNRGGNTVSLAGWALSDDKTIPGKWVFPVVTIAPGEYLVVFASGKDRKTISSTNRLHTNFKLSSSGEHLGLYSPDSPRELVSGFPGDYPEQRNDISFGYDENENWRYFATPTPGAPNGSSTLTGVAGPVHASVGRGVFNQPFDLHLSTETVRAVIRFTTDGSEPTATTGQVYTGPLRVTNTTLLRATAFRPNYLPSKVTTHSYFFNLSSAQMSLPVLSIVTSTNHLVGPSGIMGINGGNYTAGPWQPNQPGDYHNPSQRGIAWERPTSVELIRHDGVAGFQVDCGIRIQGSDYHRPRTTATSKFSLRLYFRGDYGPGLLNYPVFESSPVHQFNQLVLRGGFNDQSNPFIRDELTRRLNLDQGQVAVHGTFYNVFVNGQYKGYYNPCDRIEEFFLQSHHGGGDEWDVIGQFGNVIDGDRTSFASLLQYVDQQDMASPAHYREASSRLDLTNFVDYLLLNVYCGMGDWPPNNWRAGRDRSGGLFRFYVWDGEWAMGIYGRTVTRDTFAESGGGPDNSGLASVANSEIARLYQRLRASAEFRLLFADRIHKNFFYGGALENTNIIARFNAMRSELLGVLPNMDLSILNTWVPQRRGIIMGHFNNYGLIASSNAPVFSLHGGRVARGFGLSMNATNGGGTIYYTTNGTDPRTLFTGAPAPDALAYTGPVEINHTMLVRARTRLGQTWSAVTEAKFTADSLGVPLRITEIMYNPIGGSLYEFIELKNISGAPVDLSGMSFDGINFAFPEGTTIGADAVIVLASNTDPSAFAQRYPTILVAGFFGGNLSNGGERIALKDRQGRTIISVDYKDSGGWPVEADGEGYSLEIIHPDGDPDDPANWKASAAIGGSPGVFAAPPMPSVRINELMADNGSAVAHEGTFPDWIELHNAGGSTVDLGGWSLTDDANPRRFVFPPNTTIAAGGYLVVWCDSASTSGLHTGFGLGRNGETVFLYDAATNRVDGVTFGMQLRDFSMGRVDGSWQLTTPTPNAANSAATLAEPGSLILNEWMANPPPGVDGWIELFNSSIEHPVALAGFYLGTSNALFQIRTPSFLAPGGFIQLHASENSGDRHLDFKLSPGPNAIILYDPTGGEINRVTYTAQIAGVSQGRLPDGSATVAAFPGSASPGASNYQIIYDGPYINEVMARNRSALTNAAGRTADWIELYNPSATEFDLSGMSLSVDELRAGQWAFPDGAVMPAQSYLVIWCDGNAPGPTGEMNTGRSLNGESGGVYLFNTAGQVINSVDYGFQVPDLSIGRIGAQWRLLSAPTPGAGNAAAATLGAVTNLMINEWMARPLSGNDWFEIYNRAELPVELSGLYLTDDPSLHGRNKFQIAPLCFIAPQGWVRFFASQNPGTGRNEANFSLRAEGETLRIYTSNFSLVNSVSFGLQQRGVSQGRLPDGAPIIESFPDSATPGAANYRLLENVLIHELLTHSSPPLEDAIELYNPSPEPASIGGWWMSDSRNELQKIQIPDGTVIPAEGFLVLYENQFSAGPAPLDLSAARGGELWISQADSSGNLTGHRAVARFGPAADGVSFGLFETSVGIDFTALAEPTFGAASPGSLEEFRLGTGAPNSAPAAASVVINELMYHPPDLVPPPNAIPNFRDEYIELHNGSASTVPLYDPARPANRWRISSGVDFGFPANVALPAGGHLLVVSFDPVLDPPAAAAFRTRFSVPASVPLYGPFSGRLDNSGEVVELSRPDVPPSAPHPDAGVIPYVVVDRVDYRATAPWPSGAVRGGGFSLQRRDSSSYGNEPLNWAGGEPTPGRANSPAGAPPVFDAMPLDQTVGSGSTVVLSVIASGAGPIEFQWRYNKQPIADATSATLRLDDIQLEEGGDYDVIASNSGGAAISRAANIFVTEPPSFIELPRSLTVAPGATILFSTTARGSQPLHYQWYFKGEPVPGADAPNLFLENVQLDNSGPYELMVSNAYGSDVAPASLIVLVAPVFLLSPQTQIALVGETVTFKVVTYGTEPFGYRWRKGSSPLIPFGQGTDTLTLTNVQLSDAAEYSCVVTNAASLSPGILSGRAQLYVLADTDADGLPDEWESLYGFDPEIPGENELDSDGDGMTNREEYLAGTDPLDPESYLRLDLAGISLNPSVANLQFTAVSNRTYTVLYSEDLSVPIWLKLGHALSHPTNRVFSMSNTNSTGRERFYRLVTPFQP